MTVLLKSGASAKDAVSLEVLFRKRALYIVARDLQLKAYNILHERAFVERDLKLLSWRETLSCFRGERP